ncbi:MAG: hypothetical protein RIF39_04170 [Cyclobacteriaceae bacterium]
MNKSTLIVTGVVVLVISSIIIFYMIMGNTPEQPYKEVNKIGDIEIRYYPKAWMATVRSEETTYKKSSNNNFQN